MLFEVLTGGGHNNGGTGPRDAAFMQTQYEHDAMMEPVYWPDLLAQYRQALALPPGPVRSATLEYLKSEAESREARAPKYWYTGNTERPKHGQTSSWVGNIDYDPRARTANIQMGDKIYTYVGVSPDRMAELLTSPSIGRMLNEAKVPHKKGEIVYHGI